MAPDHGMRIAITLIAVAKPEQEERFEPFVPTAWRLEQNRYDRINAKRKYLSDVARAKRHFGIKKPIRKPNRRKQKR